MSFPIGHHVFWQLLFKKKPIDVRNPLQLQYFNLAPSYVTRVSSLKFTLLQVITALCCLLKKRKLDDSGLAPVKSDSVVPTPNETCKSNESESNLNSTKDGPSNENFDTDLVKVNIEKYSSSLEFISKSQLPLTIEQRKGNNKPTSCLYWGEFRDQLPDSKLRQYKIRWHKTGKSCQWIAARQEERRRSWRESRNKRGSAGEKLDVLVVPPLSTHCLRSERRVAKKTE